MSVEKQKARKAPRKEKSSFARNSVGKPLTRDAGIFKIRGIGESKEPGGWSWRKHELPSDCGEKSHPAE